MYYQIIHAISYKNVYELFANQTLHIDGVDYDVHFKKEKCLHGHCLDKIPKMS